MYEQRALSQTQRQKGSLKRVEGSISNMRGIVLPVHPGMELGKLKLKRN